jgi:predicted Zn-dependent peptidase
VIRAALLAVLVTALAAACGPGKSNTKPAPFPTGGGDVDPTEPVVDTKPVEPPPPMTQTAKPQELTFPDEAFRAEQPKPLAERPFNLPKMKPFTLKNGIKVYLVEQHALPIVSIELGLDGGAITDPAGKEGLASVCMSMMTEGTQRLDKIAFSEALADIASSIGSSAGDEVQSVSMGSLTKHLDTTLALFAETLRTPGFRPEDLDRMIKRRIEAIKQSKATPASIAGRVSSPVLYGPDHPFGAVTTEKSLEAITIDDCKAYHAKWIRPKGARLFVVGDLTEAQVREKFEGKEFAGWTGKVPAVAKSPAPKAMTGRIFLVDVPGAAQSQVAMMHFGPKRTAADYFPTMIMSSVFGGGFASRINMNLREDKGYSYGARGSFSYSRNYGVWTAGAGVVSNATYQTLLEISKEVDLLRTGATPATTTELEREKNGAILGMPGRFATASASLAQFRSLVYYGLPLNYYATYNDKVGKVTAAQVSAAAKKHLKPADAVYVVVGDANAKMIAHVPADGANKKKDIPLEKDGKQLTLREALQDLVATGKLGKGDLIELDADGQLKK